MPKELEEKLKARAAAKGLTGEARDRYIYGTMRNKGWKPKAERKSSKKG